MTTYTFTRGRTNHEHGSAAANNTPALRDYDVQVQTALTSIGTDITTLQGYGALVFAKGITAEDTSTGVTAGTNETAFTNQVTIPADTLAANDRIRVRGTVKALTAHSTDTLALKLKLATTADLTTTALTIAAVAGIEAFAVAVQLRVQQRFEIRHRYFFIAHVFSRKKRAFSIRHPTAFLQPGTF